MLLASIPMLHVNSSEAAEAFYCDKLGFTKQFAYRVDESRADPCYLDLERDGVLLHLSSFSGDGVAGNVALLRTDDVDALHREFITRGVAVDTGPVDQTWGTREMYVRDADGNSIRFQQALSAG